jgi:hypothetical protein
MDDLVKEVNRKLGKLENKLEYFGIFIFNIFAEKNNILHLKKFTELENTIRITYSNLVEYNKKEFDQIQRQFSNIASYLDKSELE